MVFYLPPGTHTVIIHGSPLKGGHYRVEHLKVFNINCVTAWLIWPVQLQDSVTQSCRRVFFAAVRSDANLSITLTAGTTEADVDLVVRDYGTEDPLEGPSVTYKVQGPVHKAFIKPSAGPGNPRSNYEIEVRLNGVSSRVFSLVLSDSL
jgi:hypothetical protein